MSKLATGGARLRPGAALLGLLMVLLVADTARGQEPVRPPTPLPDTTVAPDSLALPEAAAGPDAVKQPGDDAATAADTLEPVLVVERFPRGAEPSWRAGVWEWGRKALQASGAVTLTDLLEQIPGIVPIRYGLFGQPEAVSAWGLTGGGVEVVLDGFALDPLDAGVHDLSRIELVTLERVRVERVAGRLRIELETLAPADPRPYSTIEAGTGEPNGDRMLRGVFQTPKLFGGPFSVGMDRVDSDGLRRAEPANMMTTWVKWAPVVGNTSLQFEMRRGGVERTLPDGSAGDGSRKDWVVRARSRPLDRVTTEAFFGISSMDDGLVPAQPGDAGPARTQRESVQGGVRAAFQGDRGWSRASVRVRSHESLPAIEAELSGGLYALGPLYLSGSVGWSEWRGEGGVAYGARAELGPVFGFAPFAEVSGGRLGVPFLADPDAGPFLTDRSSFRVGGEFARGGLRLGGAFLTKSADSVPAFGLPFDRAVGLQPGGELQGWEVTARVPLFWEPLSLQGWHTRWIQGTPWIYTPRETWRAAVVYDHSPLPSGNLEILAQVGAEHRSDMIAPGADGALGVAPAYTVFDAYLQIRVLTVRAFVRWENLLRRRDIQDFPGRSFPQQRVFYGVKWEFWN